MEPNAEGLALIFGGGTIVVFCCIGLLFLAIFGIVGFFIYKRMKKGSAARDAAQTWLSVPGKILESEIRITHNHDNTTSQFPYVSYSYTVKGKSYQGETIRAGEQFFNVRWTGKASEVTDRYPVGGDVTVYYNPEKPEEAALER